MNKTATYSGTYTAPMSMSRRVTFFETIAASFKKEFQITLRYKADLIANQIQSFLFIGVFALMASAFEFNVDKPLSFVDTIIFFLSGLIILFYDGVALWKPINSVNRDLYNGTLEYLFFNPHSRVAYFIGNILTSATFASIFSLPLLITLIILAGMDAGMVIMMLLAIIITLSVLVSFGVMISLMAIMFRQTNSLVQILSTIFTFLSGMLFPISSLPASIQTISLLLPYTYGIDLIRYYAFSTRWTTIMPVINLWGLLLFFLVFYWVLAIFLLKKVENYAKRQGLHLI